jgi:phage tail sheath gpL-like
MIAFTLLDNDSLIPGTRVENDSTRASRGLPGIRGRILVIGQQLSTGTAPLLTPKRVQNAKQAVQFYGPGSMLANELAALIQANPRVEVWAIGLDDPTGSKAVGNFAFAGTATADGIARLYIGGVRVNVPVAKGDTAAVVAAAAVAAINALTTLPVTAAQGSTGHTGEAIPTCKWKGTTGNLIDLRTNYYDGESLPAGITCTVTAMATGTGSPALSDALAVVTNTQYTSYVSPFSDSTNFTALDTELERRFGPEVQMEGVGYVGVSGSSSTIATFGAGKNSKQIVALGTGLSPTAPWEAAAILAATSELEASPARPRTTLKLQGMLPPADVDRFDKTERNLLLVDGVSTYTVNDDGSCRIERLVTTYKTNDANLPDTSYQALTMLLVLSAMRVSVRTRFGLKYPRCILADDDAEVDAGIPVMKPKIARAELTSLFEEWMGAGWSENKAQFERDLLVERSESNRNRLQALIAPEKVGEFLQMDVLNQFGT